LKRLFCTYEEIHRAFKCKSEIQQNFNFDRYKLFRREAWKDFAPLAQNFDFPSFL